jgi:hypothetical protein
MAVAYSGIDRDLLPLLAPPDAPHAPFVLLNLPGGSPAACYLVDDLPPSQWASPQDQAGNLLPVQLQRVPNIGVQARWLDTPPATSHSQPRIAPAHAPGTNYQPFVLNPGQDYKHPAVPGLTVQFAPWGGQPILTGLAYPVPGPVLIVSRPMTYQRVTVPAAALTPDTWEQLVDDTGQRLLLAVYARPQPATGASGPGLAIDARWLPPPGNP